MGIFSFSTFHSSKLIRQTLFHFLLLILIFFIFDCHFIPNFHVPFPPFAISLFISFFFGISSTQFWVRLMAKIYLLQKEHYLRILSLFKISKIIPKSSTQFPFKCPNPFVCPAPPLSVSIHSRTIPFPPPPFIHYRVNPSHSIPFHFIHSLCFSSISLFSQFCAKIQQRNQRKMFADDKFSQENSGRRMAVKRHSISGGCGFDLSNLTEEDGFEPEGPMPPKQIHLGEKEAGEKEKPVERMEGDVGMEGNGQKGDNGHGKYIGFGTVAIHAGNHPERWDMNQVVTPISLSTTYRQPKPGQPIGHDYSRAGNPTRDVLEENIAALERGQHCRVFSSGLSATAAMANWVNAGGHVILSDDGYGGTQRYFRRVCNEKHGIELDFVDLTKLEELKRGLKENTKMIWFETPSNPLLKVIDIQAVVQVVKAFNPSILVVVDNTFMSPLFQRPLAFGADAVLHSLTKYINGHSDVVMGAIVTNNARIDEHLFFQQLAVGAIPSAFDTYLVLRGIKTLHLRMRQHMENALAIAKWLEADSRVEKVLYPELESHPQHKVHKRQSTGMSGMISFYLRGGLEESQQFLSNLNIFMLAESLGGYESLAELPSIMTHASVPPNVRRELGIGDNLIRLSVGCEDQSDLLADLDQALKAAIGRGH